MSEAAYRDAFAVVGYELGTADAVPDDEISRAETRLGCTIPLALRSFYRLAGNASRVMDHYDHLLWPEDWWLDGARLVFLTENQSVVLYAVDTSVGKADPAVLMSSNAEPFEWFEVCASCSEFLRVMVHWEGAFGGAMPVTATARVAKSIRSSLEVRLQLAGEVNSMWAYGKPGLAVCLVKWSDGWRVFIGASGPERLADVEALGVVLETDKRRAGPQE